MKATSKRTWKIASAFTGIIVGAGLASGQEILQYFTSFGLLGILGAIVTTALFAFTGMMLVYLGSRLQTNSHKDVIYKISGKYLGTIIDYVLIFTTFGVGVVMIAGAGANLNQQFGVPHVVGTALMTIIVLLVGMLKVNRVVGAISSVTPFLILFVVIVSIYSFFTMDSSYAELNEIAQGHESTLPNWFVAALNYVSFNISVGAAMAIVMGGDEKNTKVAARGGLIGGLMLGIIIMMSHLAIFSKVEEVGHLEMPTLGIVNDISPVLGVIMAIVLFGMIFNTAISMFYSFTARFVTVETKNFKIFLAITLAVGFLLSFVGFTGLVAYFYPLIGYLGLVLIGVLIVTPFRIKRLNALKEREQE
ncbi:YkvI family membrane protein [Virgibacillus kimchii]